MKTLTTGIVLLLTFVSVLLKQRDVFTEPRALLGDEPDYVQLATSLVEGKGFVREGTATAWRTPGFPAYLAMIRWFTRENEENTFVTRMVVFLLNCSITPLIAWLTWLLFKDDLITILASLFWSLLLNSRALASEILGEEPSVVFLLAGFILGIYALRSGSLFLSLSSGVVVGLAVLTRGYLLPTVVVLPLFYLLHKSESSNVRLSAASFAGALLVMGAWMGRNAHTMDSFTLSTEGTEQIWIGSNAWTRGSWDGWNSFKLNDNSYPQTRYLNQKYPNIRTMSEVELASVFAWEAINEIVSSPGRIVWLLPRKAAILFHPTSYLGTDYTYLGLFPFFLAGCIMLSWRKGRRDLLLLLLAPILSVLSICLLTFGDPRFRHSVDPFIVIIGCYAIAGVLRTGLRMTSPGNV